MKHRFLLLLLFLVSLNMAGQVIKRDKCQTCGKLLSECQFKGKHPTCKTCGKVLEQCQYKGQHPICATCGKLVEKCEHKGTHPKCNDCGKLVEDCLFKGKHPRCNDCGKLTEDCEHKGNHPKCATCGKLVDQCEYKGKHPVIIREIPTKCQTCSKPVEECEYKGHHPVCITCGKLVELCEHKGDHPVCRTCGKIVERCEYKGNHPTPIATISEKTFFNKNEIYASPEFQVGSLMGVGGSIGGYLANINAEGYFYYGLTESDEVWWNPDAFHAGDSYDAIYLPLSFGARVGYGIGLGSRTRITPQIGIGSVCTIFKSGRVECEDFCGYATTGAIGIKAEIALLKHFTLGIAPEYRFCMSKSKTYDLLSSASAVFDKWATGFNCRLSLSVYF